MRLKQYFFISIFALCCLNLFSCTSSRLQLIENPQGTPISAYSLEAKNAMVVAPNEQISQIGKQILQGSQTQAGGNAVDAAIAASFAMSVLRPQSTGLGGGGFMLIYLKEKNQTMVLDFRERAPLKADSKLYGGNTKLSQEGPLAVATPGLVAGLWEAYQQFGSQKIAWEDLLAPAIRLAEEGFAVYPHLAMASEQQKKILPELFLPKGAPLKVGDILIQKDLAKTLRVIAKTGATDFYRGGIADQIVKTLAKSGGILQKRDLLEYQVVQRKPVDGTFLGYHIVSMPPPSSGGIHLIEILNILEKSPLPKKGYGHVQTIHWMIEAMRRAYADRARYLGDPDFISIPSMGLLSKSYAEDLATSILPDKATPRGSLSQPVLSPHESSSTAHISVVDAEGNAVATTQTINYYFGSGIVVPGTGIVLNDEMDDFALKPGVANVFGLVGGDANSIQPGKRPLSSMTPTMVFDPKGKLFMVVGSPGGSRIITTVAQILINSIAYQAPPLKSIAAARIHHQWLPDEVYYEKGALSDKTIKMLTKMGHVMKPSDLFVTDTQLIQRKGDVWIGVSDPRWNGRPAGY